MNHGVIKNYVNGQWLEPKSNGMLNIENPSNGEVIGVVPLSTSEEANNAIEMAARAFPAWSSTPVSRRVRHLYDLLDSLRQAEEELSRLIAEENGKSLPDARAEIKRLTENCEVACSMPSLQQGESLVGASEGIDGEVLRLPLGVFTMAGPFNFPGMVPFWFVPYALATGNTYVMKPSEQTPLTMARITAMIDQAGIPPGVFNLVNGNSTVVKAFMAHPKVMGISLVGSSRTCRVVAETCARNKKRFQAMGGAKNHLVAMPDAKLDEMIGNMITSCYGCAGQRCMASSAIVAVGEQTHDLVCEKFIAAAANVMVADPLDPLVAEEPVVMGPVISAKAKEFVLGMVEEGVKEGARLALDGRNTTVKGHESGHFIGPTVFTDVQPGMKIHQTEIFGPVVVILRAETLDEAIGIINDHPYGNGASIYTQSGYWARRFKMEAQCGMIGVNVGIPAPVACLPFGGMKASQFSDIKAQGRTVIRFFTEEKIITQRYWPEG